MFKKRKKNELINVLIECSKNSISIYRTEISKYLEQSNLEEELDESKLYDSRAEYLDCVLDEVIKYYEKKSPKICNNILNLIANSKNYEIDNDKPLMLGTIYYLCYIAIFNKEPSDQECVYLNHFQNDLMKKVLIDLDSE